MRWNTLGLALSVTSLSYAFPSQAQETATVLPKGIFRIRAVGLQAAAVTHSFDNDGNRRELLADLNGRIVSSGDIAQKNAQFQPLYQALNDFQAGLGDALFQSSFQARTQAEVRQYVFAAEYGLTPRVSLGLIVPTVDMSFTRTSFTTLNEQNIAAVRERTKGIKALEEGVDKFAQSLPSTASYENAVFTDLGYETPHDFSFKSLGDIEIGAKYQFLNVDDGHLLMTTQGGFRLPTTTHVRYYPNPLDRNGGDDQLDFALRWVSQYTPDNAWVFSLSAQYTYQFADRRNMYVLKPGESGLPRLDADHNEQVRRDLGEIVDTEVSAGYGFLENQFRTYSLWTFSSKGQDGFSGGKDLDYSSLSRNTRTLSHRAEIGLGYSTIPLFRKKRFSVPLETKIAYNTALNGMNVSDSKYLRLDMIVYF